MQNLRLSTAHVNFTKFLPWYAPSKYIKLQLKNYRGVVSHDTEKFEEELTCHFKTDMRNLKNFDQSTQKSQKCAL